MCAVERRRREVSPGELGRVGSHGAHPPDGAELAVWDFASFLAAEARPRQRRHPLPGAMRAILTNPDNDQQERSSYILTLAQEGSEDLFLADDAALLRSLYRDRRPQRRGDAAPAQRPHRP